MMRLDNLMDYYIYIKVKIKLSKIIHSFMSQFSPIYVFFLLKKNYT